MNGQKVLAMNLTSRLYTLIFILRRKIVQSKVWIRLVPIFLLINYLLIWSTQFWCVGFYVFIVVFTLICPQKKYWVVFVYMMKHSKITAQDGSFLCMFTAVIIYTKKISWFASISILLKPFWFVWLYIMLQ